MNSELTNEWVNMVNSVSFNKQLKALTRYLTHTRINHQIFPENEEVFRGINMVHPSNVKVVIIGQDPYHGNGQANGMAFSVKRGVKIPPSLRNIYKELKVDTGLDIPDHGDLTCWAKQGVLLLNSVLTVVESEPGSHADIGWEVITDEIIQSLSRSKTPLVFMLWGGFAKSKTRLIDQSQHLILESAHPSPLSAYRGFFGCKHFSKANAFLHKNNVEAIRWNCL